MNWLVWECNKQTSHSIHSGNWANTCAFRFGCWFRTCLASTCENGVVQRPKAYREFSNDQWYQNYCGYNQKQHPSGSAWSFQHSSTYLNIFQLWFTFPCFPSHMCSPFPHTTGRRCRRAAVCAWAASGAPGSRGSVWSLTTPTNTRNARTAGGHGEPTRLWGEKVGKNNYSDNTDNSDSNNNDRHNNDNSDNADNSNNDVVGSNGW